MWRIIAGRLLAVVPIWLILSVVSFSLIHLAPGSPAAIILGPQATPTAVRQLTAQLGLGKPLDVQYVQWLGHVVHGNFGTSFFLNSSVGAALVSHFAVTAQLAVLGFLVAFFISLVCGTVSAVRPGSVGDVVATALSLVGFVVPEFVLGLLGVLLLAVLAKLLPVQGYVSPGTSLGQWAVDMVLPVLVIGVIQAGALTRIVRVALVRSLGQDYVRSARSWGLAEWRVVFVHALRPALLSVLTASGLVLATLLSGVFVTELVFHLPGLGEVLINSALERDYPTVQAGILLIGTVVLLVNLAVDITYVVADPRMRRR